MEEKDTIKKIKVDGVELTVDLKNVDDMDFLELSDRVQKDITAYPALLKMLIGEETYSKVREHYKKKNGKFTTNDASNIFESILKLVDPKD